MTRWRELLLPVWLPGYRRELLPGDFMAALVVAVMLVPQAMAYAMLAGLPPQSGLYAAILPLAVYAWFCNSRYLAVGPVALTCLMTASILAPEHQPGTGEYIAAALSLALLTGLILLLTGLLRFGALVSYLSHPVLSGFTSAAAIIIGVSQLGPLLGIPLNSHHGVLDSLHQLLFHLPDMHLPTLIVSGLSLALLLLSRSPLARLMRHFSVPEAVVTAVTKTGALLLVLLAILFSRMLELGPHHGIRLVGHLPATLPSLSLPLLDTSTLGRLLPGAALLALVAYVSSISVARALASKRRQKVSGNRELVALGLANLSASFSGAFPVAGGFSRSAVNFSAGANTPLASLLTAVLVALSTLLLAPAISLLPMAVLSVIVLVSVFRLFDLETLVRSWHYNRADAVCLLATFFGVLLLGLERGLLLGVATSLLLYLWRTSHPHVTEIGRLGDSEQFRSVERHEVRTCPHLLLARVDESLYFANADYLEDRLLALVAERPALRDVVLVCSAVNFIDSSALLTLEQLLDRLRDAGVRLHLADLKEPVIDALRSTDLLARLEPGKVFLSAHQAMKELEGEPDYSI